MSHADCRIRRIVDFADEVFGDNRSEANHLVIDGGSPCHSGEVLRNTSVNILREHLDEFGAALIPPHLRRCHFLAIIQRERVRQVRKRICERFIVVGVIWRLLVPAWSGPERFDAQLIHHVLMILIGGKGAGGLRCGSLSRCAAAASRESAGEEKEQNRRPERKRHGNPPR